MSCFSVSRLRLAVSRKQEPLVLGARGGGLADGGCGIEMWIVECGVCMQMIMMRFTFFVD
jgi:hypothetical protein